MFLCSAREYTDQTVPLVYAYNKNVRSPDVSQISINKFNVIKTSI